MTMQRPISSAGVSNSDVDCRPPQTQSPVSGGLGALSSSANTNLRSPSAIAAAATTALGLLTNNNDNDPTANLSLNGNFGSSFRSSLNGSSAQSTNHNRFWGQNSTLSSAPLLSPMELAGASERKGTGNNSNSNSNSNDHIQALLMAQMRQRIQQEQEQQQLQSESLQAKKRPRLMTESPASDPMNPLFSNGMCSAPLPSELGQSSLLGAGGGLPPSLLRSASDSLTSSPSSAAAFGGLSNLLSPSMDLNNALSNTGGVGAGGSGNMTQIQKLLRKQQLQELQQLQQLKQREDMQRISQLQSRDAVLQFMLQQQQQQQQAMSVGNSGGNTSLAAQLKALQDQQDQQQNSKLASSIEEANVANFMRRTSQGNNSNGGSQQNNVLQQMQALAKFEQQQDNDGMPPPPPMVSAVSSLDSVAIMSMLLPQNQQNQNRQQQQQTSSSNDAASRLLGTELSLGATNGGLGAGSALSSSLLAPMPFPSPSLGNLGMSNLGMSNLGMSNLGMSNLGMGSSAAALLGGLGGVQGSNSLSSMLGRQGVNGMGGSGGLALHPSAADVIYEQRRLAAAAEVSNTVRDSSVGKPPDAFVDRDPDGRAHDLPTLLVVPMDHMQLSSHQTLLRYQIEVFRAGEEDTSTHTRGRNKPVQLGQIGIRCRHCKVLPVSRRKRGSVYFPRAVEGFYQAAQNMNSTHLQTGECPLMGNALRQEFANLIATRGVSTGAGRAYWAKQARKLGLRNTENGIVFDKKEPAGNNEESDTGNNGSNSNDSNPSETSNNNNNNN